MATLTRGASFEGTPHVKPTSKTPRIERRRFSKDRNVTYQIDKDKGDLGGATVSSPHIPSPSKSDINKNQSTSPRSRGQAPHSPEPPLAQQPQHPPHEGYNEFTRRGRSNTSMDGASMIERRPKLFIGIAPPFYFLLFLFLFFNFLLLFFIFILCSYDPFYNSFFC